MKKEEYTLKQYQRSARDLASRYETADVRELHLQLLSAVGRCETLLELGCGSGRDAAFLLSNSRVKTFTVTDGSENMLAQAAVLHPGLQKHLKLVRLPGGIKKMGTKYHGIYSIAALMHLSLPGIERTIDCISDALYPGGILFISICTEREEQPASDSRLFTLKSIDWWVEHIESSGFTVISVTKSTDGLNRIKTVWQNVTAVKPF
ncbi:MAG: hypothetical protein B1H09_00660 [Gemmatimonadaceae bacterium 4484_173]|nr:MAG: hypothetical protein B1H09_00660 [Gemmatimonadaceae bacterium 4484_173]